MALDKDLEELAAETSAPIDALKRAAALGRETLGAEVGAQLNVALALAQSGKSGGTASALIHVLAGLPGYDRVSSVLSPVYRAATSKRW